MTRCTHALIALLLGPTLMPFAHALDCKTALTQADMNACAYEDFLAANAAQAASIKALETRLKTSDRSRWRSAQKAWIAWRTAQCSFESGTASGGSVREMLRWQCVTRQTQARTTSIERLSTCPEGDLVCPARKP